MNLFDLLQRGNGPLAGLMCRNVLWAGSEDSQAQRDRLCPELLKMAVGEGRAQDTG